MFYYNNNNINIVLPAGRGLRNCERPRTPQAPPLRVRRWLQRPRRHIESDRRFTLTIVVALPSRTHTRTNITQYINIKRCTPDNGVVVVIVVHFAKTIKQYYYNILYCYFRVFSSFPSSLLFFFLLI